MELDAFEEWLRAALTDAGFATGAQRNFSAPIDGPTLRGVWPVFRASLAQPLTGDCGAFVVVEFDGPSRRRTCTVQMGRRSGWESWIEAVTIVLECRAPAGPALPRMGADQFPQLPPLPPPGLTPVGDFIAEVEASPTFQAALAFPARWRGTLQREDHGS